MVDAFPDKEMLMRTMAVMLIALLTGPAGTFAEDLPAGTPPPGFLRAAAIREGVRLGQAARLATGNKRRVERHSRFAGWVPTVTDPH